MPLTRETLILAFLISGLTLKLADLTSRRGRGYIFATISAVCMGLLISESAISSSIILGIIIGVTLGGKVDQPNLAIGLVLTLVTAVFLGFNIPNFPLLVAVTAAALIDELGHDRITSRDILKKFFSYRMTLKTTIVLLTIFRQIDVVHAVGFFAFDLSYDMISISYLYFKDRKTK